MATCSFCDATVDEAAERCPSCSAVLRRACPSCGKINPVHIATCFACGKDLPALSALPELKVIEPIGAPRPPSSLSSNLLRILGFFHMALAVIAAFTRQSDVVVNSLAFSFVFFFLARLKDTTDGTWEAVNRIESQLNNRSRRR